MVQCPAESFKKTVSGKTPSMNAVKCEIQWTDFDWKPAMNVGYFPSPPWELWRIPSLQELLEIFLVLIRKMSRTPLIEYASTRFF